MIAQIAPADFQTWLASQSQEAIVLDVREGWELQTASIKPNGFTLKHLPMSDTPTRLGELSADSPIACLCHHGARSYRVAQFLVQNGFVNVINIAGGIAAWAQTLDNTIPQY